MVLLSQDPTVCQTLNHPHPRPTVPEPPGFVLEKKRRKKQPLFVDIPPMSTRHETSVRATGLYS